MTPTLHFPLPHGARPEGLPSADLSRKLSGLAPCLCISVVNLPLRSLLFKVFPHPCFLRVSSVAKSIVYVPSLFSAPLYLCGECPLRSLPFLLFNIFPRFSRLAK